MKPYNFLIFTAAAVLAAAALGVEPANAQREPVSAPGRITLNNCPNGVRPRREIRTLSDSERQSFINAIRQLQQGAGPTRFDDYAKLHFDSASVAHSSAVFLPWHRRFLRELEIDLQQIDPNITIPYWEWCADSQAPEKSIVFTKEYFGGNGRGKKDCVTDGPFADWKPHYVAEAIQYSINHASDFFKFSRDIESTSHATVHNGIGGGMWYMYSPSDPLFYLHHAMIDRVWWQWQKSRPGNQSAFNGKLRDGTKATPNTKIAPWNDLTVKDMFDTEALCYTYSDLPVSQVEKQPPSVTQQQDETSSQEKGSPETPQPSSKAPAPASDASDASNAEQKSPQQEPQQSQPQQDQQQAEQPKRKEGDEDKNKEDKEEKEENKNEQQSQEQEQPVQQRRKRSEGSSTDGWLSSILSPFTGQNHIVRRSAGEDKEEEDCEEDDEMDTGYDTNPEPVNTPTNNAPVTPDSQDRDSLTKIRMPPSVPDEWLTMNFISVNDTRQLENQYKNHVYDKLNSVHGYVSPCALVNRGDIVSQLIASGKTQFTAGFGTERVPITLDKVASSGDIKKALQDVRQSVVEYINKSPLSIINSVLNPDDIVKKVTSIIGAPSQAGFSPNSASNFILSASRDFTKGWVPLLQSLGDAVEEEDCDEEEEDQKDVYEDCDEEEEQKDIDEDCDDEEEEKQGQGNNNNNSNNGTGTTSIAAQSSPPLSETLSKVAPQVETVVKSALGALSDLASANYSS